jgi:hypothetical protein
MLFVGVAPRKHVGEGSDVHSETKIFNLETHEFGSNPQFLKKTSLHFHFLHQKPREQKLKKYIYLVENVAFFLAGTGALKKNLNSKTWNF